MTDLQYTFLKTEYLTLSNKVDILMSAIEDLRAAEADLSAVIDHTVKTVGELAAQLDGATNADAEISAIAGRLRNLKDVLTSHVGDAAPVA